MKTLTKYREQIGHELCRKAARSYHKMSSLYRPVSGASTSIKTGLSKSSKMLLENGYIRPSGCSGCYHFLPLGLKTLEKLEAVIDDHLDVSGCQKILLSSLSPATFWNKSGRMSMYGSELLKSLDRQGKNIVLNPTHEESVCELISAQVLNEKALPLKLYQITKKYRDEMRVRFGLLRSREFSMLDLYTFDCDETNARRTYEEMCLMFENLFNKLSLPWKKAIGCSGMMGGTLNHEYHLISEVGEDALMICQACDQIFNEEVFEAVNIKQRVQQGDTPVAVETFISCPNQLCQGETSSFSTSRSIEIGHTFLLGSLYTKQFDSEFVDESSKRSSLFMGSYGIGITRLLGAIIESSSKDYISWPVSIAPYFVAFIPPKTGSIEEAEGTVIAGNLKSSLDAYFQRDLLIDDRVGQTIGKRLRDLKQSGIPIIIVVGKGIRDKLQPVVEVHNTINNTVENVSPDNVFDLLYNLKNYHKM